MISGIFALGALAVGSYIGRLRTENGILMKMLNVEMERRRPKPTSISKEDQDFLKEIDNLVFRLTHDKEE